MVVTQASSAFSLPISLTRCPLDESGKDAELRVLFDTCVTPAHTPQHPEIVGCDAAIYLERLTRKRAPVYS